MSTINFELSEEQLQIKNSIREFAESEMFRSLGYAYGRMFEELDVWLPRRHIECDFLSAARLDDLLEVSCWVPKIGTTSLTLAFEVHRGGELIATASYVLVAVDRHSFAKLPIPEKLIQALADLKG